MSREWAVISVHGADEVSAKKRAARLRREEFRAKALFDVRDDSWAVCVSPPADAEQAKILCEEWGS